MTMRASICGLALVVLLPTMTGAQKIQGVVIEDGTGKAISDARVELLALDSTLLATSISAATGWFELAPANAGQFLVRASHVVYDSVTTVAVDFRTNETLTVVLRLTGGAIRLEPVVVKAKAVDRMAGYRERAGRNAFGRFITHADLDKFGAYNLSHALRFAPEVKIERVQYGPFVTDGVFMRSFAELCVPAIFLDGVRILIDDGFDINGLISPEEIEGIEVYRSALTAPVEFRLPALSATDLSVCGIIAVWSRQLPRPRFTAKALVFAGVVAGVSVLIASWFR